MLGARAGVKRSSWPRWPGHERKHHAAILAPDKCEVCSLTQDDELDADALNNGAGAGGRAGAGANGAAAPKRGLLASFVNTLAMNVVGKAALTHADVEPALAEMKRKLMERNVAEEIAAQVGGWRGRRPCEVWYTLGAGPMFVGVRLAALWARVNCEETGACGSGLSCLGLGMWTLAAVGFVVWDQTDAGWMWVRSC